MTKRNMHQCLNCRNENCEYKRFIHTHWLIMKLQSRAVDRAEIFAMLGKSIGQDKKYRRLLKTIVELKRLLETADNVDATAEAYFKLESECEQLRKENEILRSQLKNAFIEKHKKTEV